MNFNEYRKANPQFAHIADHTLAAEVHQRYYKDTPYEQFAREWGVPMGTPDTSRSFGQAALDTGITAVNSAAGIPGAIGEFVMPGNPVSGAIDDFTKWSRGYQSDVVKAAREKLERGLQTSDVGSQLGAVWDYVKEAPLQTAAEALGNVGPIGGAMKAVGWGAKAANLGTKAANYAVRGTGAALGGAASGGDAAGTAYDLVMDPNSVPDDLLIQSKDGELLHKQGVPIAEIRERLATEAARRASIVPALLGGVAGMTGLESVWAGSKSALPKALADRIESGMLGRLASGRVGTGLVEAGTEFADEAGSAYMGRSEAAKFNPAIDPMEGVVGQGALAAIMSGGAGVALGGSGQRGIAPENVPGAPPAVPQLTTEMQPLQPRVNAAFGIEDRVNDPKLAQQQAAADEKARTGYVSDVGAAFNEPSGVYGIDPATQQERELTQGEYLESLYAARTQPMQPPRGLTPPNALPQPTTPTGPTPFSPTPGAVQPGFNTATPVTDVTLPTPTQLPTAAAPAAPVAPTRSPEDQRALDVLGEAKLTPTGKRVDIVKRALALRDQGKLNDGAWTSLMTSVAASKYAIAERLLVRNDEAVQPTQEEVNGQGTVRTEGQRVEDGGTQGEVDVAGQVQGVRGEVAQDGQGRNGQEVRPGLLTVPDEVAKAHNDWADFAERNAGATSPHTKGAIQRKFNKFVKLAEAAGLDAGAVARQFVDQKTAPREPQAAVPSTGEQQPKAKRSRKKAAAKANEDITANAEQAEAPAPLPDQKARDAWEEMRTEDMTPYDDLSSEQREEWEQAVESNASTGELMDNIDHRAKRNKRVEKTKRLKGSEPTGGKFRDAEGNQTGKFDNVERVRKLVDTVKEKWKRAPHVKVVQRFSELPLGLQRQGTGQEKGAFYDGSVYLVADNLDGSDQDAILTFLHETAGHYGLRSLFRSDEEFVSLMNRVYYGNAAVRKAADGLIAKGMKLDAAVEEVLAEEAAHKQMRSWFQNVLKMIRDAIKRAHARYAGQIDKFTDRQVADLLQAGYESVSEGKGTQRLPGSKDAKFEERGVTLPRISRKATVDETNKYLDELAAADIVDLAQKMVDEDPTGRGVEKAIETLIGKKLAQYIGSIDVLSWLPEPVLENLRSIPAPKGTVRFYEDSKKVALFLNKDRFTTALYPAVEHTFHHEVGHVADAAMLPGMQSSGGIYSSHPDFAYDADGTARGAIAKEAADIYLLSMGLGSTKWRFLGYPILNTISGRMGGARASMELFAQLWATHMQEPTLLENAFPAAHKLITAAVEHAATLPHMPLTAKEARREARKFRLKTSGLSEGVQRAILEGGDRLGESDVGGRSADRPNTRAGEEDNRGAQGETLDAAAAEVPLADALRKVDALNAANPRTPVTVGQAPAALVAKGLPNKPLYTSARVLDKVIYDHSLPPSLLKRIPELLNAPAAVFQFTEANGTKSMNVLLSEQHNGTPVMVSIHPQRTLDGEPITMIASVFRANELNRYVEARGGQEGKLLWADRAKTMAVGGKLTPRLIASQSMPQKTYARFDPSVRGVWELDQQEGSYEIDASLTVDTERTADILSQAMYGDMKTLVEVSVKELMQNSFDALKDHMEETGEKLRAWPDRHFIWDADLVEKIGRIEGSDWMQRQGRSANGVAKALARWTDAKEQAERTGKDIKDVMKKVGSTNFTIDNANYDAAYEVLPSGQIIERDHYGATKETRDQKRKLGFTVEGEAVDTKGQDGTDFTIRIDTNQDDRTVTVYDNGIGMDPETVRDAFLRIAGTKKNSEKASGGFGIAKMQFLLAAESINLITVRNGKMITLVTSGKKLRESARPGGEKLKIKVTEVDDVPNSFLLKLQMPKEFTDPGSGEVENIPFPSDWELRNYQDALKKSPLFYDIAVVLNNGLLPNMGKTFDKNAWAPFASVKFKWGNATILVTKDEVNTGEYGNNVTVLSNGIYQFGEQLKVGKKNIPRNIIVNLEPRIRPEEIGYPIAPNRQGYSGSMKKDAEAIMTYLAALYEADDLAEMAAGYGSATPYDQYGDRGTTENLVPDVDKMKSQGFNIKPGDKVEVKEGRVSVNGKELPELKIKDLSSKKIDLDAFKIDQAKVNPNKVWFHDNLEDENGRSLTDIMEERVGREKFGKFIYDYSQVFLRLRKEIENIGGTPYKGLEKVPVGISADNEYYGVHTMIPYRGMFLNPMSNKLDNMPVREQASAMLGTMIHEIAHFPHMNHSTNWSSEMQRLFALLMANGNAITHLNSLEAVMVKHERVINELKGLRSDLRNRGKRLKDGAEYEGVSGNDAAVGDDAVDSGVPVSREEKAAGTAGDARFRSAAVSRPSSAVATALKEIGDAVAAFGKDVLSARKDAKKVAHVRQMLTSDQLVDSFPEIEGLSDSRDFMNKAGVETNRIIQKAAVIDRAWLQLPKAESDKLNALMQQATLLKVHPELPLDHEKHDHLRADPNAAANHARVQRLWNDLSPEAQKVYKQVRDLLSENWKARAKAYRTSVERLYDRRMDYWNRELETADSPEREAEVKKSIKRLERLKKTKVDEYENRIMTMAGPYFPLMRFGDYIVVADSRRLADMRNRLDAAEGDAYNKLAKEIEALERDPANYIVEAYDHRSQAEQRVRELGVNYDAYWQHGRRFEESQRALTLAGLRSLELSVEAEFDKTTANRINEVATEFYLQMSPALSALKRQLERRGIAGANPNMHRAFAEAVRKDSQYIPQLEYSGQITDSLMRAERSAKSLARKGQQYAQLVVDEMKMRHELDATVKETPVQDLMLGFSYWKNLALSPAFLFANLTQPYTTTIPQLIRAHTLGRTTAAFRDAAAATWRGVGATIRRDGWLRSEIDFSKVTNNAQERDMLQQLLDSGAIDITMRHDLGISAQAKTRIGELMNAITSAPVHHTEVINRVSSALAAYRLARSHPTKPKSHEAAIDYARKIVNETQINYNPNNAARIMREGGPIPWAKVIFQFRRYQQGMFYVLARDMYQSVRGKSPEEKREARRAVFATLAIQSAFAGALGWPVAFPMMALAKLVAAAFGDDDEPFDPEVELRNYLTDQLGADGARAFMNGLPTLLGMNLTKNVGFGDVFNPVPFLRDDARSGREVVGNVATAVGGASIGGVVDVIDGTRLIKDGQVEKGLEKIIPFKPGVNLMKGHRFATEGITTGKGEPAYGPDNFDGWDIVLRGVGVQPQKEADYWMATVHKEDVVRGKTEGRQRLLRDWSQAKMRGEDTSEVDDQIAKWNARQPADLKITVSDKLKARKTRQDAVKERGDSGVRIRKNEKYVRDELRFLGE